MSVPANKLQFKGVDTPVKLPLVNKLQSRITGLPLTKDARLINCFAELDEEDKAYWIYKRFGIGLTPTLPYTNNFAAGMYIVPGNSAVVWADHSNTTAGKLYQTTGGNISQAITFPSSSPSPVWFESVGAGPYSNLVIASTGVQAWQVSTNPGTFGQIVDPNYPATTVPGWAYLDGTLYTMDPSGNIFGTNVGTLIWNPLNVIVASSNNDPAVALTKQLNYVIAFKQYTTQVFYDAGNAVGSPLSPVPDAQIPLGCAASNSVAQIDNTLLWLTSNQTFSPQIVRMDNLTPKIVSTPAVERILDQILWGTQFSGSLYVPLFGVFAWALKHAGHRFYILVMTLYNLTLVYDLDQELWYIWTDANGNFWPWIAGGYQLPTSNTKPVHLAMNYSNGGIYPLDTDDVYPNDIGVLVPVDIYTPNVDFGTIRRKYLKTMYIDADKVPSKLQVRFTDDDYNTFSNFREVDLNTAKPRLTDCGTFTRRRAWHFRHQANTAMRIRSVDLQMDVGTL